MGKCQKWQPNHQPVMIIYRFTSGLPRHMVLIFGLTTLEPYKSLPIYSVNCPRIDHSQHLPYVNFARPLKRFVVVNACDAFVRNGSS